VGAAATTEPAERLHGLRPALTSFVGRGRRRGDRPDDPHPAGTRVITAGPRPPRPATPEGVFLRLPPAMAAPPAWRPAARYPARPRWQERDARHPLPHRSLPGPRRPRRGDV